MATVWSLCALSEDDSVWEEFVLIPPALTLGRGTINALVLDRESISTRHARFSRDPEGDWWVEDLQSTNGIWKGETQITGLHQLTPGEILEFGIIRMRVEKREEPDEKPEPIVEKAEPEVLWIPEVKEEDLGDLNELDPEFETEMETNPDTHASAETHVEVKPIVFKKRGERPSVSQKLELGLEWIFTQCAWLHAFLSKWLPRIIGWTVQHFLRLPLPARFSMGFGCMALLAAAWGWWTLPGYWVRLEFTEEQLAAVKAAGLDGFHTQLRVLLRGVSVLCLGAGLWAWVRKPRAMWVFKGVLGAYYLVWLYVFHFYTRVPAFLNDWDWKAYPNYIRNEHWLTNWTPWILVLFVPLVVTLGVSLRAVREYYVGVPEEGTAEPLVGDEVVNSLRTGGRDPQMRSSSYWVSFLFFLTLSFPFLLSTCGWEKPYGLPKGSGEPVVEMVKVKRKKEKPKKKMIVNNWSPYIFERMKLDDIKVLEDLEAQSMDTYEIMQEKTGKLGKGGGKKGGWPEGMEGTSVRFIRLEYAGGDWDQDMGKGSDYNLLIRFNQITGFPIAKETESKKVNRLNLFPKGRQPPFVYLTGKGGLRFSSNEIKDLRHYTLNDGGMLFIDHGGGGFGRSVESMLRQIYPGDRLVVIPHDDPVFKAPFVFPGGAPPLWQHGGTQAKGIRHDGRWVVFYHPGDLGDAWKDGHSGVAPEIAEQAYRMGINVMYYAFNNYYARHFE